MNLQEAIKVRKSRRSYLSTTIEASKLSSLQGLIEKYNKEADLSMELIEDGSTAFNGLHKSYGMFSRVRSIIVLKGKKDDIHLKEKCGYYGELLALEATILDLGTCWVGASYDKNNKIFNIGEDEELTCVITVGNTQEKTDFKENLIRTLAHGKAKPLEHFYNATTPPPDWFLDAIKAVQMAPSAVNRQDFHFNYEDNKIEAYTSDTSKFDLLDLGIAKAHFVIMAGGSFEWGNHGKYKK